MLQTEALLAHLAFAHWTVEIELHQQTALEAFKGNVLHGGFGRSLAVVSTELFQALFCQPADNNQWVTPFAIFSRDAATGFAAGAVLQFELVLLGKAAQQHQAVLDSLLVWQVLGLGAQRARFQVLAVTDSEGFCVYRAGQRSAPERAVSPIAHFMQRQSLVAAYSPSHGGPLAAAAYQLQTITRCRLQSRGQPLRQAPALSLFCQMIKRRFVQLLPPELRQSHAMDVASPDTATAGAATGGNAQLPVQARVQFHDWQRFSAKEQRQVAIGGLEGCWLYPAVDDDSYFWLRLGELIGVGNKSSFGFGRYSGELQPVGQAPVVNQLTSLSPAKAPAFSLG